jgi:hypothetical protein
MPQLFSQSKVSFTFALIVSFIVRVYRFEDKKLGRMWPEYILGLFFPIQRQKEEFAVTTLYMCVCVCVSV